MRGEIDGDFFCTAGYCGDGTCLVFDDGTPVRKCPNVHRKWPTLEQFREEWGWEWTGAVYYLEKAFAFAGWNTAEPWTLEKEPSEDYFIVCACTHWSKPDKDWKPGMTEAKVQ